VRSSANSSRYEEDIEEEELLEVAMLASDLRPPPAKVWWTEHEAADSGAGVADVSADGVEVGEEGEEGGDEDVYTEGDEGLLGGGAALFVSRRDAEFGSHRGQEVRDERDKLKSKAEVPLLTLISLISLPAEPPSMHTNKHTSPPSACRIPTTLHL
jgi:hypothetical protein